MNRKSILLCLLVSSLFLSGCGTPLYLKSGPVKTIENQDDNLAAGYMARFLMPAKQRTYLLERVGKKIEQQKSSPTVTTGAGFFGAIALGQNPLKQSGLGTAGNIALGLDVGLGLVNMLGPDGSVEHIGSIYLPEKYNGQKIESADQAYSTARKYTIERIHEIAAMEGRKIECLLNCEQNGSPTFKLIKAGMGGNEEYDHNALVSDEGAELYDPPALYVITGLGEIQPAKPDPIRDAILGFTAKWESVGANSWQVHLAGEVQTTEDGSVVTAEIERFGSIAANWRFPCYTNPLGRRALRHLTNKPGFITWGNGKILVRQFCMQGRVFTYPYITNKKFIEKELLASAAKGDLDEP